MKIICLVLLSLALPSAAKLKVAASLPDLASIAASVGGDQVEAFSIARPNANPHSVEVLPSHMVKVAKAAVYLKVGLNLDAWADAVIDGSRNASLVIADCSAGIEVLDRPAGKVDASMGDVHAEGNPHYWLDPANAGRIAETIRDALKKADPSHADLYDRNARAFRSGNDAKAKGWAGRMAPLRGTAIIAYHSSWAYFAKAFGLRVVGFVEPYPGIPPTGRHLKELVDLIQSEKVALILQEPYFPDKDARFLERSTGARVVRAAPSCAGPEAGEYWKHLDALVTALASAPAPTTTPSPTPTTTPTPAPVK